jgi:hypothetical protein
MLAAAAAVADDAPTRRDVDPDDERLDFSAATMVAIGAGLYFLAECNAKAQKYQHKFRESYDGEVTTIRCFAGMATVWRGIARTGRGGGTSESRKRDGIGGRSKNPDECITLSEQVMM